jgi:hypothetical protein
MWATILSIVSTPFFNTVLNAYQARLKAGTALQVLAQKLAVQELQVQQTEAQARYQLRTAEVGKFWEPEKLAMYIVLLYVGKVVVWDTMFSMGSTGPIKGEVAIWMNLVVSYYFGQRTFQNVASIITRKWAA